MGLHRVLGNEQASGDLGVGEPARHAREHLELLGGRARRRRRRRRRRRPGELLDQAAGDRGREQRAAFGHDADRGHQPLLRCVLEQEAAGPGPQRPEHHLVKVERGEHEHPGRRAGLPAIRRGRLDAVELRHAYIHQHHVGPGARGRGHRLEPVRRPRRRPRCRGSAAGSCRKPARTSAWSSARTTRITRRPHTAARARTRNPAPSTGPTSSSPPATATRSRIPISPWPAPWGTPGEPVPSSHNSYFKIPSRQATATRTRAPAACLSTLVSAS